MTRTQRQQRRIARVGIGITLLIAGLWLIPHRWCAREAGLWFEGDAQLQQRMALGVQRWVEAELPTDVFATGSDRFNGEWLFGTYMMAGMGFGQTALEHPEWKDRHLDWIQDCIEHLLSPPLRQFDSQVWNEDPIDSLDSDNGHAAYLGCLNLLLSMHSQLDPRTRYALLNKKITSALVRRIKESPSRLLQTYPGEIYMADNCAVIASIALYDRTTRAGYRKLVEEWVARCREHWIDPQTGLLYQAMNPLGDSSLDHPRGSGTALGAYFLSFADVSLSRQLHEAVKTHLATDLLGFAVVQEYPSTVPTGPGDIDSGPLILGYSVASTGFSLAGCRIHNDRDYFTRLYSSTHLIGAPLDRLDTRSYVAGGPLGNAILFAMLTAQPAQNPQREKSRP